MILIGVALVARANGVRGPVPQIAALYWRRNAPGSDAADNDGHGVAFALRFPPPRQIGGPARRGNGGVTVHNCAGLDRLPVLSGIAVFRPEPTTSHQRRRNRMELSPSRVTVQRSNQFSEGRSIWSITSTSTGPFAGTSFRPSCS